MENLTVLDFDKHYLPYILQGEYFKIQEKQDLKVKAKCLNCSGNSIFSGAVNATTNFLTHLKRKHSDLLQDYERKQKIFCTGRRKFPVTSNQRVLLPYVNKDDSKSLTKMEKLIVNYIVKGMLPLSTVEAPEFIELIQGLYPQEKCMSRSTLERRINARYLESKNYHINLLKDAEYICITADCWTCKGKSRSFIGVTAHWVTNNLERKSCAIACKRIFGSHTYDKIAEAIAGILQDYEIPVSKVVKAITDNASNFVKAFREFATPAVDDDNDSDDEDIEFVDVNSILTNDVALPDDDKEIVLPEHHRCTSHTLSLLCTADLAKNPPKKYNAVMSKCYGLWNKISRSTKCAEIANETFKRSLVTPCITRWNSLFDSIQCLLQVKPLVNVVCKEFSLPELTENDFIFLQEYNKCVQPVAVALDRLQGEKSLFFGELTPTLYAVKKKLESLLDENFQFCKNVPKTLLDGLTSRFKNVMLLDVKENDALVAAISHPYFKLRWANQISDADKLILKEDFIEYACKTYTQDCTPLVEEEINCTVMSDDFFEFDQISSNSQEQSSETIRTECLNYFKDTGENIAILNNYPIVKKIFMKFNTPLPSSAPVERLFNYCGMILNPKRRSMRDELFEILTLLKVNKS